MNQNSAAILLNEILKIPGEKIVTLVSENDTFTVDIDAEGCIGYEKGIKVLFLAKLMHAINSGGGLVIRQFLSIRVQREMPNGEKLWIPEKNIYGVLVGEGIWRGCTKEEIRRFHATDAKTGKVLEEEEGVHFQDFIDGFNAIDEP